MTRCVRVFGVSRRDAPIEAQRRHFVAADERRQRSPRRATRGALPAQADVDVVACYSSRDALAGGWP